MREKVGFLERMRTRKFCIGLTFILISSGAIWLINPPSPSHDNVVFRSHKRVRNLRIEFPDHQVTVNPMYLSHLGLQGPRHSGEGLGRGGTTRPAKVKVKVDGGRLWPVIATAMDKEDWGSVQSLIKSVVTHMPGYRLVVFDLTVDQLAPLKEILQLYGAVIWVDSVEYFKTGVVLPTLDRARAEGIAAWTIEHPTSAITHAKMFLFFGTQPERYYFHRAVESSHLVIVDSPMVREKVMLPWVKCALSEECINPRGAQHSGCNFLRKPLFKYSGCHFYDMSALNIILGSLFDFDERPYAANQTIFGNLIDDQLAAKNTSNPLHRSRLKMREYLTGRVGKTSS
ncbi:hypothetical protein ACOMHN_067017 [Nucella lapillus]